MSRLHHVIALAALAATPVTAAPPEMLRPVPFTDVTLRDTFWRPRLETNRNVTIPACFAKCQSTGRLDNFARAARLADGPHEGFRYDDSDVFKVIEGAAYALSVTRDAELERYVDGLIETIAAAQEPDGYLYTARTIDPSHPAEAAGATRWSHLAHSHELYNAGHLYEAAVAWHQATGKRTLLEVAIRNADLMDREFGPGRRVDVPGHEEIEIGLVKLARETGEERYLKLARFFIDRRGRPEGRAALYGIYAQDHEPVVEQTEPVGHAVRAMYLYSAMADVAAATGDADLVAALARIWENMVRTRLYLTGGVGARQSGESFGEAYELPNKSAYNETCAAIGNAMWNHRMALLHRDARYADVLERVIYNGFLAGVSLEGDTFFYPNPLASTGSYHRSPWFSCSCCPVNVARFLPSIPGWATDGPLPGDLYAYVFGKPGGYTLAVNGEPIPDPQLRDGYARLKRSWSPGDRVTLDLEMRPRLVRANDRVEADRHRVAIVRGPIVYCLEAADNDGRVTNLWTAPPASLSADHRPELLGDITVIHGKAFVMRREPVLGTDIYEPARLTAIPYYAWGHREPGEMIVGIPANPDLAQSAPVPTLASRSQVTASHCHASDTPRAANDQREPTGSADRSIPRLTWWDRLGTTEWVQYDFPEPQWVKSVSVYWFDDTGTGGCRVPASWRLLYREPESDTWQPVPAATPYGVDRDAWNTVTFDPVRTPALRLEVQLQHRYSGGVLEWRVE
jgi:DUF1680 family protein